MQYRTSHQRVYNLFYFLHHAKENYKKATSLSYLAPIERKYFYHSPLGDLGVKDCSESGTFGVERTANALIEMRFLNYTSLAPFWAI